MNRHCAVFILLSTTKKICETKNGKEHYNPADIHLKIPDLINIVFATLNSWQKNNS
jgi:hypothetical protein